jgi:hypothetical protein
VLVSHHINYKYAKFHNVLKTYIYIYIYIISPGEKKYVSMNRAIRAPRLWRVFIILSIEIKICSPTRSMDRKCVAPGRLFPTPSKFLLLSVLVSVAGFEAFHTI